MFLASYKYYGPRATLVDKIIGLITFGRYSHSELVLDEKLSQEMTAVSTNSYAGRNYIHNINNCLNSKTWDYAHIDVSHEFTNRVREIHNSYGVVPYDAIGAVLSVFNLNFDFSRNKMFCSEYVSNLLYDANPYKFILLKKGFEIYPNELHKIIEEDLPNQKFTVHNVDGGMVIIHNGKEILKSIDGDILKFTNIEDIIVFAKKWEIEIYSAYNGNTYK